MAISGVVGEWIADIVDFMLSEHLETISDKELAKVTLDTQHLATEEAEARRAITAANEQVASAQRDAANANARAKEAESHTAEVELELAKYKAPRMLNCEHVKPLIAPFAGRIDVVTDASNPEFLNFTNALLNCLGQSGWDPNPNNSKEVQRSLSGILVEVVGNDPQVLKAANALGSALKLEGLEVHGPVPAGVSPINGGAFMGAGPVSGRANNAPIKLSVGTK